MDSSPDPHPPRRFVIGIVLGAALIPLNSTMIAVALPAIGDSFNAIPGDLTLWLVTSYLLVNIILLSPAGKLGDMLGRRRVFGIGLSLFVAGALIASFAPGLEILALSRVLMAIGGAMLMPNAMALLRTVIPAHRRSRAFGYFGAMLGASAALGPLVGGILTEFFGWKAIFLANIPLLLLCWVLVQSASAYQPQKSETSGMPLRFDLVGLMLLTLTLGVLVIGLKAQGWWPLAALFFSTLSLTGFVHWERRVAEPMVDLKLFRRVPYVIGGSVTGLQNLGMYALLFQLPFLLESWYQLDHAEIGKVLLTFMIFMVFLAPVGGRLSERLGARPTIIGGLVISLGGMLLLLLTTGSTPVMWVVISLACIGSGLGIVSGPIQSSALSVVPAEQSGVASGVLSTMRYLGGIAGITIISVFLNSVEADSLLAQNLFCIAIYVGVYLTALLLVVFFPDREIHAQ